MVSGENCFHNSSRLILRCIFDSLASHLTEVLHHCLSSTETFPTNWADAGPGVVNLFEVSVQSLGEGRPKVTDVTLPRLVVLVIPVHVVHQPSESPALFAAQLTGNEGSIHRIFSGSTKRRAGVVK